MGRADDRRVGSNVRYARQEVGLSQSDLAAAMREAGQEHWHQTTVSRVERGAQSITVAEGMALTTILGPGVSFGTSTDSELQLSADLIQRGQLLKRLRYVDEALTELTRVVRDMREVLADPQLEEDHPEEERDRGEHPEAT
ncbi:helix-turn-helix domain-containing protein [Ornithinimicrobium sp. LYQ92]|uniref:helix-turn-helix domain-containing protein n=1 Tax=Serinicoccus sp. LYQ92 TaxID=3378798 RepID=UPI003851A39E